METQATFGTQATYKTGNPDIELAHQENVNCNKKQLDLSNEYYSTEIYKILNLILLI